MGHEEQAGEEVSVQRRSRRYSHATSTITPQAQSIVDCAKTCIKMGLPVGIKADDGKTYLLIGEHKPINSELVSLAAKTITVKGKLVSRDGFNMIENAEILKK